MTETTPEAPPGTTALLALADGTVFWGRGLGAADDSGGEVVFCTALTGYQETMTDPSFAGQIITFTFPHIGNVGVNMEDMETTTPALRGCILRADISEPSSWRAAGHLDAWLKEHSIVGLAGIDTRRLTRIIRDKGASNGVLCHNPDGEFDIPALLKKAAQWPSIEGMDLARDVTCKKAYSWDQSEWSMEGGYGQQTAPRFHVVAMDFGAKNNILRCLASAGCRVTVVPATASAAEIMSHKPDGLFLSNGPGDPAATGTYAVPVIQELIETGLPIFGICLGHQILAIALGAKTYKMPLGHRGANQPVKDLTTGKVEITSQNHGFAVARDSLPQGIEETHVSLFDGSVEGLRSKNHPIFSVQYHPEASPGPRDSHYLFRRFVEMMEG